MIQLKRVSRGIALTAALLPATALAGGGWIDAGVTGWNQPGGGVPGAPGSNGDDIMRCEAILRGVETGEDNAVAANGWWLYGAPLQDGGTRVVSALSGVDGDCRPMGFNDFIFVDGAYAGTVSPELMSSGDDGARAELGISGDFISVRFERAAGNSNWVSYYIDRSAGPVLAVIPPAAPQTVANTSPTTTDSTISPPPAPTPTQATVPAGPPTVSVDGSDDRAEPNARFKIQVEATSGVGVAKVSWWITGSEDADLATVQERDCDGDQECKETWRVRTLDSGIFQLHAKAVDKSGVSSSEVTKELRIRTRDGRPTVVAVMSAGDVEAGQRVNLELIAKDDEGVDRMSWTATGTTDPELTSNHEELCDGDTRCSRMWRVRPSASGTITINARAKDKTGKESDVFTDVLAVRNQNVKPTVEVVLNGEEFGSGDTVRIELVGKDDEGITRIWWYATDTNDQSLQSDHEEQCGGDKECSRTWRIVPNDTGKIRIHAKAVDSRKAESDEVVKVIRVIKK
jgi:hypothetical protein